MTETNSDKDKKIDTTETPRPTNSTYFGSNPTAKEIEKATRNAKEKAIPRAIISPGSMNPRRMEFTREWASKNKRKISIGSILGAIAILATLLTWGPISSLWFPSQPNVLVSDLNADGGTIDGSYPHYRYQPRTMITNGTQSEVFHITIQNTGDGIAKNFKIDLVWEPDKKWINFERANVINPAYGTNCQEKSNVCTFENLSKQIGTIQLEYAVQIDWRNYNETINQNPHIEFNYNYDGMNPGTKQIVVDIAASNMRK